MLNHFGPPDDDERWEERQEEIDITDPYGEQG